MTYGVLLAKFKSITSLVKRDCRSRDLYTYGTIYVLFYYTFKTTGVTAKIKMNSYILLQSKTKKISYKLHTVLEFALPLDETMIWFYRKSRQTHGIKKLCKKAGSFFLCDWRSGCMLCFLSDDLVAGESKSNTTNEFQTSTNNSKLLAMIKIIMQNLRLKEKKSTSQLGICDSDGQ